MEKTQDTITVDIRPFIWPVTSIIIALILSATVIITANILVGGGGAVRGTTTATGDTGTTTTPQAVPAGASIESIRGLFTDGNLYFGDPNSDLLFVEVSDPSCPYCHIASGLNPTLNASAGAQFTLVQDGGTYVAPVLEMKKLVDQGEAAFVWIYSNGHGNGELATQALYCADEQGKFWEAHDKMMTAEGYDVINEEVQNSVANAPRMAEFLSGAVDAGQLQACLEAGTYASRPAEDQAVAGGLGVSGTPGFFVNETNFAGAYSWTDLLPTVEPFL